MAELGFRLRRTGGFLRTMFKSKMAIGGLAVLVIYTFLALGAPLVTPYDPQVTIVANAYAPPSWYSFFGGGSQLSQNMLLEQRTGFYSDPLQSNTGWDFQSLNGAPMSAAYAPTTSYTSGAGSLRVTLDRSSGPVNGTFSGIFKRTFHWPYRGPPGRFSGTIVIETPDASPLQTVGATIFIEKIGQTNQVWNLTDNKSGIANLSWESYPFATAQWQNPRFLDSNDQNVREVMHIRNITPTELIFGSPGDYAYGVFVTFRSSTVSSNPTAPLNVFLDNMNLRLYGTSWGFLGTDSQGLDIWSQLVYGARVSLMVGLLSAFIGIFLGLIVGLIAGYMGKIVDEVLMRFTDMLLVIPGLPLLIVLVSVIGDSLGSSRLPVLILVIGFLGWMGFARVVRAQVLSLKERPFVEAARAAGAGTGHITTRHIVPNIVGLIYVNLALAVPGAILAEAALSFLGLGDVTVMSWGRMLNLVETTGSQRIWWWVLPPGLSIALVSLSFVMIGFSLDTLFNPRLRQRR